MEQVVLLDDSGAAVGHAEKASVHNHATPLHLAFSCYVFNSSEELLLTRRASSKPTWPGVWTNTCCGHPMPGESVVDAIRRRMMYELGCELGDIDVVLPSFRYRAVMANGVVENEICPVFRSVVEHTEPVPNPTEVSDARWIPWPLLVRSVEDGSLEVSPWCRTQIDQLLDCGDSPLEWTTVDPSELPDICREEYVR